jgi:hypothetical protein
MRGTGLHFAAEPISVYLSSNFLHGLINRLNSLLPPTQLEPSPIRNIRSSRICNILRIIPFCLLRLPHLQLHGLQLTSHLENKRKRKETRQRGHTATNFVCSQSCIRRVIPARSARFKSSRSTPSIRFIRPEISFNDLSVSTTTRASSENDFSPAICAWKVLRINLACVGGTTFRIRGRERLGFLGRRKRSSVRKTGDLGGGGRP